MAPSQVGVLMDEIEFRPLDNVEDLNPQGKSKLPRAGKGFIVFTYGVMAFAGIWIIATIFAPSIHASRLTFIGFLCCLIFYAGEYTGWERPALPKRKPRQLPWKSR